MVTRLPDRYGKGSGHRPSDRANDRVDQLGRWLDRFEAWHWYWEDVKVVVFMALACIVVLAAVWLAVPDMGLSPYLVAFLLAGLMVAASAGYMILRGEREYVEPLLPDFDATDRFAPRDGNRREPALGADTLAGSFPIGLSVGIAFVVTCCLAVGMPLPLDGWADAAMGHSWGGRISRVVAMVLLAAGVLSWAGWHGIRTMTGVLLAFAVMWIVVEGTRMHGLLG